jgi:ribonuclease PH
VALALSLKKLMDNQVIAKMPLEHLVAAVSVGIVEGNMLLDLDYIEDSNAETDMNFVATDSGQIVEVQATAEKAPFTKKEFNSLLDLAEKGVQSLINAQRELLKKKSPLFMAYN